MIEFCQFLPPNQKIKVKNTDLINNVFTLFTFLDQKYEEKLKELKLANKRKVEEHKDHSKHHQADYTITNIQGSQYKYNYQSDQSISSFLRRNFCT